MSGQEGSASFAEVYEAVRRIVEGRGKRFPGESLISYAEGDLEFTRTAVNEYEVRYGGQVVFRAGAKGGLSSAHVFEEGGWVEQVRRIGRETRGEKGGKK